MMTQQIYFAHFASNPQGLDEHRVVQLKKWIGHFEILTALTFCFVCSVPFFFQHDIINGTNNGTVDEVIIPVQAASSNLLLRKCIAKMTFQIIRNCQSQVRSSVVRTGLNKTTAINFVSKSDVSS